MPICPINLPMYGLVKDEDGNHTDISFENIQQRKYDVALLLLLDVEMCELRLLYTYIPLIDLQLVKSSSLFGFIYMSNWFIDSDHIFI